MQCAMLGFGRRIASRNSGKKFGATPNLTRATRVLPIGHFVCAKSMNTRGPLAVFN
jgi:hypothetical protein